LANFIEIRSLSKEISCQASYMFTDGRRRTDDLKAYLRCLCWQRQREKTRLRVLIKNC